jgi:hypothetical protein
MVEAAPSVMSHVLIIKRLMIKSESDCINKEQTCSGGLGGRGQLFHMLATPTLQKTKLFLVQATVFSMSIQAMQQVAPGAANLARGLMEVTGDGGHPRDLLDCIQNIKYLKGSALLAQILLFFTREPTTKDSYYMPVYDWVGWLSIVISANVILAAADTFALKSAAKKLESPTSDNFPTGSTYRMARNYLICFSIRLLALHLRPELSTRGDDDWLIVMDWGGAALCVIFVCLWHMRAHDEIEESECTPSCASL